MANYIKIMSSGLNSPGMFEGRSGLSVCLFEISRFLKEKSIENYAFKLLKQSLLSNTKDISIDYGLSGVGFALHYLIENKFVQADFNELFHDKHLHIIDKTSKLDNKNMSENDMLKYLKLNLYISRIYNGKDSSAIQSFNHSCLSYFSSKWERAYKKQKTIDIEDLNIKWRKLLSYMSLKKESIDPTLFKYYKLFQNQGLVKSDPFIIYHTFHLSNATEGRHINSDYLIKQHIHLLQAGIYNWFSNFAPPLANCPEIRDCFMENFNVDSESTLEKNIKGLIRNDISNPLSLNSGIGRVILQLLFCYLPDKTRMRIIDLLLL